MNVLYCTDVNNLYTIPTETSLYLKPGSTWTKWITSGNFDAKLVDTLNNYYRTTLTINEMFHANMPLHNICFIVKDNGEYSLVGYDNGISLCKAIGNSVKYEGYCHYPKLNLVTPINIVVNGTQITLA